MIVSGAPGKFLSVNVPNTIKAQTGERIGLLISPDVIGLLQPEN
jgi:putative spermidine/putrescine transport system ATP-binding protein